MACACLTSASSFSAMYRISSRSLPESSASPSSTWCLCPGHARPGHHHSPPPAIFPKALPIREVVAPQKGPATSGSAPKSRRGIIRDCGGINPPDQEEPLKDGRYRALRNDLRFPGGSYRRPAGMYGLSFSHLMDSKRLNLSAARLFCISFVGQLPTGKSTNTGLPRLSLVTYKDSA